MAFGAIELTTVSRVQDISTIKQNEDNKGAVIQTVIGEQAQKDTKQRMREVNQADNSEFYDRRFDARDKGDNEYRGDGGSKRKEKKKHEQVVVNGRQGFDMKI
ncbi:MAG: hypothetical protein NC081_05120 [Roseburia sp.]|nr:hypothetical protein [Roseburia sp.]